MLGRLLRQRLLPWSALVLVATILLLQINQVKRYLFNQIGTITYNLMEIGFRANRVTGLFPIYLRLKGLELYDKRGTFAQSEIVRLSWDLTALLTGDVHIRKLLLADNSRFMREPEVSDEPTDTRTWFQQLRDVVADMPGLRVDELQAKSLQLGPQVFGNVRSVNIHAAGQWVQGQGSDLILDVSANTYSNDYNIIKLRWSLSDDHLNVFAKITESPGGIISYLTESELGRIEVDINGRGDLSNWQGGGLINVAAIGRSEIKVENTSAGLRFITKNFARQAIPVVGQHFGLSFVLDTVGRFLQHPDLTVTDIIFIAKSPTEDELFLNVSGDAKYSGDSLKTKLKTTGTVVYDDRKTLTFAGDLDLDGDLIKQSGKLNFQLTAQPLAGADETIVQLVGKSVAMQGSLSLAMNKLHIEQLQASSSNGATLNVSGNIKQFNSIPILHLQAKVSTPEVEWLDDLFSAKLFLDVLANGPVTAPTLQAKLNATQAHLGNVELKQFYIQVKSQKSRQFTISGGISDGTIKLSLPGQVDLGDKQISFQQRVVGPSLLLQAKGQLTNNALTDASVNFKCQQLDLYEQWLDLDLDGSLNLQAQYTKAGWNLTGGGQQLGINNLGIRELILKAQIDDSTQNINISARDFDWQQISATNASFSMQSKGGKGSFKLDIPARSKKQNVAVKASGRLDMLQSQVVLQQLSITPPQLPLTLARPVTIKLAPLQISPVSVSVGGQNILKSSEITIKPLYKADAQITNFPLEFFGLINPHWQMYGGLSGALKLSGTQIDPRLQSSFNIKQLQFIKSPNSAKMAVTSKLEVERQQLKLNANAKGDKGSGMDLNATVNLVQGQLQDSSQVKATFRGRGDMRAVAAFLASGDALSGLYNCNLNATGTMEQPQISGSITVNNGGYENLEYGTIIKNIQLRAIAGGRRLTIANCQGRDIRDGRIRINGYVEVPFRGNITYKLEAKLSQFLLAHSDFLVSKANGSVTLERKQEIAIFGGLTLAPTILNFSHMKRGGQVPMIKIKEKGQEEAPELQKHKKSIGNIDLKLKFLDRLMVRGFGLNSQWKGNLNVIGALNDPAISGQLDMVKGVFLLLGNSMKLTKGNIKFTGTTPINPTFLVKGERPTSYMTAYLTVDGDAKKPHIQLSSNPPYPQEEIISRILFGQEPGALSPLQAFQLASIATSFKSSGTLSEKLGGGFGMKSLFPNKNKKSKFDTKIGDGLSDRVRVNLSPGIGQGANIEAQITDNITFDADVGGSDPAAFGLSWVKRY